MIAPSIPDDAIDRLRSLYDEAASYADDAPAQDPAESFDRSRRAQEVRFRLNALALQYLPALLDELQTGRDHREYLEGQVDALTALLDRQERPPWYIRSWERLRFPARVGG